MKLRAELFCSNRRWGCLLFFKSGFTNICSVGLSCFVQLDNLPFNMSTWTYLENRWNCSRQKWTSRANIGGVVLFCRKSSQLYAYWQCRSNRHISDESSVDRVVHHPRWITLLKHIDCTQSNFIPFGEQLSLAMQCKTSAKVSITRRSNKNLWRRTF